ncbi:MAG: glycosyltransferase [bacterium]
MGKIALIHLSDCFYPRINGVTIAIETLIDTLHDQVFDTYIIAPNYQKSISIEVEDYKGSKVIRIPSIIFPFSKEDRFMKINLAKTIYSMLSNYDCFILFFHNIMNSFLIGQKIAEYVKKDSKRVIKILYYHTFWEYYLHYLPLPKVITKQVLNLIEKFFLNAVDYIMVANSYVKQKIENKVDSKNKIIINPLPLNKIFYGASQNKFCKLKNDNDFLLYVGRIGKEKNIYFLIDVFREFLKLKPDCYLYIVGDGPEKQKLIKYCSDIADKILFLGYKSQDEIIQMYRDAKGIIFVSKTETLGLVVVEAMACGGIVFALDTPPFNKIIKNMENGVLISYEEPKNFAYALANILSNNQLAEKIRRNASSITNHYNPENFRKIFIELTNVLYPSSIIGGLYG